MSDSNPGKIDSGSQETSSARQEIDSRLYRSKRTNQERRERSHAFKRVEENRQQWKRGNRQDSIQRNVLPIPDVTPIGLTTFDAKDPETKYPPIRPLRPHTGAPNVLVVLIDDAGFGSSSAFGGPCQTPNFEKLAATGLKYTRFHTTALCSPNPSRPSDGFGR